MEKLNLKLATVLTGSLVHFLLGGINEWLLLLFILMTADFLTGIAAAYLNRTLASARALAGIFKKAGYLGAVLVGYCLDFCAQKSGVNLPHGAFGLSVTLWLTATELLSLTENLGSLGVPLPDFLTRAIKTFSEEQKQDDHH